MKRTRMAVVGALSGLTIATIGFASQAEAKTSTVTIDAPFGSINIKEVVGPKKGQCVDIPVVIDVNDAKRAADALPLRVSITDASNKFVAVTVWDPAPQSIRARKYRVTMEACGKPHTYTAPSLGRGYNVITWDPRGEFESGGRTLHGDIYPDEFYEFLRQQELADADWLASLDNLASPGSIRQQGG